MQEEFTRTALLIGQEAVEKLEASRVAVFGVGGVGGYVAEALARAGVGQLDLIDDDVVSLTNLNRQIIALHSTLGQPKVEVAAARIRDIHPQAVVRCHRCFYLPDTAAQFDFRAFDYVVDAIDTVTGKLMLAEAAWQAGTPIISAMGAGNKLDPTGFQVTDISKTRNCPLARVMRKELKSRGIPRLKVVYSQETPLTPDRFTPPEESGGHTRRQTPGSISFVPGVVGLIAAGEVVRDLLGLERQKKGAAR